VHHSKIGRRLAAKGHTATSLLSALCLLPPTPDTSHGRSPLQKEGRPWLTPKKCPKSAYNSKPGYAPRHPTT
jgi:hypothetical protein